jgi:hypothetical protein
MTSGNFIVKCNRLQFIFKLINYISKPGRNFMQHVKAIVAAFLILLFSSVTYSQITLPRLVRDSMVLQEIQSLKYGAGPPKEKK